jgi:hypothetical protein
MRSIAIIGALALAAAPLSAQSGKFGARDTHPASRDPRTVEGQIFGQAQQQRQDETKRKSTRIPPGQMPPAGMCRVWIDGVPPGQQPAPTDCQTAVATKPANARVIFGGDGTSFPGKANGKFNKQKGDRDDDDRDDDDRRETRNRTDRGGILGSVSPSTGQQLSGKTKSKKNGKGRN